MTIRLTKSGFLVLFLPIFGLQDSNLTQNFWNCEILAWFWYKWLWNSYVAGFNGPREHNNSILVSEWFVALCTLLSKSNKFHLFNWTQKHQTNKKCHATDVKEKNDFLLKNESSNNVYLAKKYTSKQAQFPSPFKYSVQSINNPKYKLLKRIENLHHLFIKISSWTNKNRS